MFFAKLLQSWGKHGAAEQRHSLFRRNLHSGQDTEGRLRSDPAHDLDKEPDRGVGILGGSVDHPVPFVGLWLVTVHALGHGLDHLEPGRLEDQGLDPD